MTTQEYRKLTNEQEEEYAILGREWIRLEAIHTKLNIQLGTLFERLKVTKEISSQDLDFYLRIRTENDLINSAFKIISTKTNETWVKRQTLDLQMLKEYSPNILFSAIDAQNGRLKYWLEFKEEK